MSTRCTPPLPAPMRASAFRSAAGACATQLILRRRSALRRRPPSAFSGACCCVVCWGGVKLALRLLLWGGGCRSVARCVWEGQRRRTRLCGAWAQRRSFCGRRCVACCWRCVATNVSGAAAAAVLACCALRLRWRAARGNCADVPNVATALACRLRKRSLACAV